MFRSSVIAPLLLASATAGAACTAQSGADRPHVVELYTSEGCDSCPPAERWMSTLRKHSDLIGLEFHVDYWDGADFRDPFSDHAYTQRQQALARRGNHDQIFTPQIWVDGRVWKNWPKAAPPSAVDAPAPVLRVTGTGGDGVHMQVDVDGAPSGARIYAAISESGLTEHVRGGENRGKTLNHDEVVRAFAGPLPPPHAEIALSVPQRVDKNKASLVAFVEDESSGDILQALRLPLPECSK